MMIKPKRYHPLTIVFKLWEFVKSVFLFAIILFVFNGDSDSFVMHYGRIAFVVIVVISLGVIVYNWLTHKYMLKDGTFHLYQGLAKKTERRIPFSKVHNIQRHRSFLHRLFNITSITFETSMSGPESAVKFKAISLQQADEIEQDLNLYLEKDVTEEETLEPEESDNPKVTTDRTIHFKPTRKDTIKAAFTSFSFLLLIPIIFTFYIQLDDFFGLDDKAEGVFNTIISSWWFIALVIVALIIASIIFGLARAFIKYGKYEISSDDERIYITRGMVNELSFSIDKEKVQAIEITQSFTKRILGLAEVKLISAGSFGDDGSDIEASSLYPFLPVRKAYEMIHNILPLYSVSAEMSRLPRQSLWVRLLRPSWLFIIATGALLYFKPPILSFEQSWWMASILILILVTIARILDFVNTRYTINGQFIQLKSGSLETSLFISRRDKVVEIKVSRNKFQQLLGLSSIHMVNRAKPVHHTGMLDVPAELADSYYAWYAKREVKIDVE